MTTPRETLSPVERPVAPPGTERSATSASGPEFVPEYDTATPVLILKLTENVIQHGAVAIIRSLGSVGVPVYACVEDRLAPAAWGRHLTKAFTWRTAGLTKDALLAGLMSIAERIARRTVLIPTDDLGAIFIAEHAAWLRERFLFPSAHADLPGQLANKKRLYRLCKHIGIPCPEAAFPESLADVEEFISRSTFPVVVKIAELGHKHKEFRSVQIVRSAAELLSLFRLVQARRAPELLFQEYIPDRLSEDWIYHGYTNPRTKCRIGFTGRKLRSYPVLAGSTTLGVSQRNKCLASQAEEMLNAISYSGIVDLDYRFDKRDGQYKLLDFNPRVGANFRMFENRAGIDVVRALHLDLTGRRVPCSPPIESRTFVVEPYDVVAALGYISRGALSFREWRKSLRGTKELAWFRWDDPVPFLTMFPRLLMRTVGRVVNSGWSRFAPGKSSADSAASHSRVPSGACSSSPPRSMTNDFDATPNPAAVERRAAPKGAKSNAT